MGDLSKNFSRWEFACKGKNCCGGSAPVCTELIEALQKLRDKIGKPIDVSSGFRCITHNNETPDAVPNSQHTLGKAADISVDGMTVSELLEAAREFAKCVKPYPSWVHFDVRSGEWHESP